MKKISEMKDEELIDLVKGLYNSIHVVECYSSRDLILFEAAVEELERRGYRVCETIEVVKDE